MHISLPFGRVAAVTACILLSACATGGIFNSSAAVARPDPALGAFLAARYAESIGDSDNAARFYTMALKADPQNQTLVEDGFLASLLAGNNEAAGLAPRLSGNALATLTLGNQAVLAGHYKTAAGFFKTLPNDDLTTLIQPLLLAWVEFGQGQAPRAQAVLQPAFNNGPFAGIYVLNAALIADATGETKQAAQLYNSIPIVSPNLRVAQILASWYARQGDKARADLVLEALAVAHPDLRLALPQLRAQMYKPVVATPAQGMAEAYLTMAASLSQPQALFLRNVFLRFALSLRPDLSAARLILANSLLDSADPNNKPTAIQIKNALDLLAPVLPEDPLYSAVVMDEASLQAQLDQPDAAVALVNRLIINHPDDPGLLAVAGDIRRNANQCGQALPYYQKAIALLGTSRPKDAWSLFFNRGICEDEQGNWTAAEPDILQALQLSPNQPYVLNYLAYRWAEQNKNLEQAQKMLLRAVSLDPNDGALLDSLGFVELKLKNTQQAILLLITAVQLAPNSPEVNAHLGDAFSQAGQNLQAIYQWDRALFLGPDEKLKAALSMQIKQAIETMSRAQTTP